VDGEEPVDGVVERGGGAAEVVPGDEASAALGGGDGGSDDDLGTGRSAEPTLDPVDGDPGRTPPGGPVPALQSSMRNGVTMRWTLVAIPVSLVSLLLPAFAAASSPCQHEYYWPDSPTNVPVEISMNGALFVRGNNPPALVDPNGDEVVWAFEPLGEISEVELVQPAGGWLVGEYEDLRGEPEYAVTADIDEAPPEFTVLGWEGLDPSIHIGCGADWYQQSRVGLSIDEPDEPWAYEFVVFDQDGAEVTSGWGPVQEWGLEIPVDAATEHDIELTLFDSAGHSHTELIEGVRGCGGCSGSVGGGAATLAWLPFALLLGRRRREA